MITDEGTIYFGHRTEAGDGVQRGTGDRHRLRYRVRNGQIEFSLDDRRDIGDELCRAYADGGLEQQLVDAHAELAEVKHELTAVLIACRLLEGDVGRLRDELVDKIELEERPTATLELVGINRNK